MTTPDRSILTARPACFSTEEWESWCAGDRHHLPSILDWACTDCTPQFKAHAMRHGKCDWPCVQFVEFADGSIEGRRMSVNEGKRLPGRDEEGKPRIPIKTIT